MNLKYIIISFLFLSWSASCQSNQNTDPIVPKTPIDTIRGAWITNVASSVMYSNTGIKQAVARCKASGLNHIYICVWNKGYTLYPSATMNELFGVAIDPAFSNRDPLQEMITEAHANNMKVFAWFEYGFAASYMNNGGHILAKFPSWAAKDETGGLLTKNGFEWMNPIHPEVQKFMLSLISEVVTNYDIDGIQGDDRLPAMPIEGGYDAYTVSLYKTENNGSTPPEYSNINWKKWRTNKLNTFQQRFYETVKTIKANVKVCNAPSIYPWGLDNYLQDWPTWLNDGYTDLIIPQLYRYDLDNYQSTLKQQLSFVTAKSRAKFQPAVLIQNGTYNPDTTFLKEMIHVNRRLGISNESFWFYEGLDNFESIFTRYKQGNL